MLVRVVHAGWTRELGAELRRVREQARFTGHELAKKLGWSPSKVSRIETGGRNTSEVDAAVYLAFCGMAGDELNRLLDLARESDDGYWLQAHGGRLPDELRSMVVQETTAQVITYYEPCRLRVVPALVGSRTGVIGPFIWMAHQEHNPVIYVEHLTTSLFLEGKDDMLGLPADTRPASCSPWMRDNRER